jgi:hypothetical protein
MVNGCLDLPLRHARTQTQACILYFSGCVFSMPRDGIMNDIFNSSLEATLEDLLCRISWSVTIQLLMGPV